MGLYFRRIYEIREDNDVRQKEIAGYLNIHPNVYRRYEKGDREVPVWVLVALADYYKVSTDYLLGRSNDRRPRP